jgi:hypothetical protein
MFYRFVESGLMEFNEDKRAKRVTPKYYETAYLDAVQKVNESVQKVNSAVQKVNTNCSKSEHISKVINSKDKEENAPAQILVTTYALETLPETNSLPGRAGGLADDWQAAAKAMIEYLTANPQQLQSNLKGQRTPPANWPDAVNARMRWMAGQGEWFQLTVPQDAGRLRLWQVQMTAKIASWIDSPFDGAKTGQVAPAAFTPSYSNYKPKQ